MTKAIFTYSLFLAVVILTFVPIAQAQKQSSTPQIGILLLGAPPNANLDVFIQGLRELGYRWKFSLEASFQDWKRDLPADFAH